MSSSKKSDLERGFALITFWSKSLGDDDERIGLFLSLCLLPFIYLFAELGDDMQNGKNLPNNRWKNCAKERKNIVCFGAYTHWSRVKGSNSKTKLRFLCYDMMYFFSHCRRPDPKGLLASVSTPSRYTQGFELVPSVSSRGPIHSPWLGGGGKCWLYGKGLSYRPVRLHI